jgi:hypothetical protein
MAPEPTGLVGVDHAWIRAHLGWEVADGEEIQIRSISGTGGEMGSVHQVACGGRSFILKGPPTGGGGWADLAQASGVLDREVAVYGFLRSLPAGAPKFAPDYYWTGRLPGNGAAFAIEDLGPPLTPSRVMGEGLPLPQATAAVRSLAVLHAVTALADADSLSPPVPWLYSAASADLAAAIQLGLRDLPRVLASQWPSGIPGVAVAPSLAAVNVTAALADGHIDAHCAAFCHGDAWAGNIVFGPPSETPGRQRAYLIDWQFAMWGNPLSDIALLLLSSVPAGSRDAWRDELLAEYHRTFNAYCSFGYPLDACHADLHRTERLAALVALATLEAYASGMEAEELALLAPRATDMLAFAAN